MRWVWWLFLICIVVIIQATIAEYVKIKDIKPDFVLITVLFFSLIKGPITGEILGFFGGLLQDIFSYGPLGINAFSKTVIGFIGGYIPHILYFQYLPSQFFIFAFATFVEGGIIFLLKMALSLGPSFDLEIILIKICYNSILALIIYKFLSRWL